MYVPQYILDIKVNPWVFVDQPMVIDWKNIFPYVQSILISTIAIKDQLQYLAILPCEIWADSPQYHDPSLAIVSAIFFSEKSKINLEYQHGHVVCWLFHISGSPVHLNIMGIQSF